jgi:PAS domain S-box-containing protein
MLPVSRSLGLFAADGLTPDAERTLASISNLFGAVTLALGLAGVAGWFFDIPFLRHLVVGFPAIRPLSAVCLGLLGGALWLRAGRPGLSSSLALAAGLVAALSLVEFLAGVETTVRQIVVHPLLAAAEVPEISSRSGLTAPVAALGYTLLAAALLLGRIPALVGLSQTLAITVMFFALVPVIGFAYRIESLSSPLLPSAPSLQGSLGIALLAIGISCTNPQRGAIGLLAGSTAGSRAARRLLIPALGLPILSGGVFIYARQLGAVDIDTAVPTFVCALAATLGGSVLWVARGDARMEILHRRGEEALRQTADASPLMTWMADSQGSCSHMNPAALDFAGQTLERVLDSGWHGFTHREDLDAVEREVRTSVRHKRPFSAEFRIRHADGSWRWILSTGMPRFTPTHELSGYTGTWVDVTERKDSEYALKRFAAELETKVIERTSALTASKEELSRQTRLLESIVRSMGDALLAISSEGEILLSNDAAVEFLGATLPHSDKGAYGYFHADGVTPFENEDLPLIRALRGEKADNVMMVVRHESAPDGLSVRITARPIIDESGQIAGSIIVGRDVTEFEKALVGTRRLAAVVESSGDAILSVGLDGRISSWNRGAEDIYGYTAAQAIGIPLDRLDPSPGGTLTAALLSTLRSGAASIRRDTTGLRRDGSTIDVAVTMSPVHDDSGRIEAISVVHHDVSHLKDVERRIHALNEELEQRVRDRTAALVAANHDLANYASSVAHDLRTPLRSIAGFAHVLEEDYSEMIGAEGRRVLGIVRKNAQDMGAFIDALLQFSAVERSAPNKAVVDVARVVRECVDSLGADCAERDVTFQVGDLPSCHADPASLKQLFLNLLSNAVKFTRRSDKARIEIGCRNEPSGEAAYFVRDNGVGFDMSNTRRLFGIFQRLHSPAEFEGTGLGLANVARIVAAHGGRVWAEAEPGKGATFFFIIETREGSATA